MPKKTKTGLVVARGRSKAAKADSVLAIAASAAVARASNTTITTVLSVDMLAYIHCCFEGGPCSVALLSKGCAASKAWQASVQLALANEVWRAPYLAAGKVFVLQLPEYLIKKA